MREELYFAERIGVTPVEPPGVKEWIPVDRVLNTNERRVLGSLLEKSMAQPEYYPMTEKALTAACNQKQNRDPVMELSEDEVWQALETMRERGLVTVVLPGPGARSKRYKHNVGEYFGWQVRERAIMTELLLRGPQTAGELRSRCSRFVPFDDLEAVTIVLDCLAGYDPPMAEALPREPGRSAIRYKHLLYPDNEQPVVQVADSAQTAGVVRAAASSDSGEIESLRREIATLTDSVAALTSRLDRIERELL